jgi:hypothetical protein
MKLWLCGTGLLTQRPDGSWYIPAVRCGSCGKADRPEFSGIIYTSGMTPITFEDPPAQ